MDDGFGANRCGLRFSTHFLAELIGLRAWGFFFGDAMRLALRG
jgi:hypothetical protein